MKILFKAIFLIFILNSCNSQIRHSNRKIHIHGTVQGEGIAHYSYVKSTISASIRVLSNKKIIFEGYTHDNGLFDFEIPSKKLVYPLTFELKGLKDYHMLDTFNYKYEFYGLLCSQVDAYTIEVSKEELTKSLEFKLPCGISCGTSEDED